LLISNCVKSLVIKGSFASPEAIAHIAVQKYVMCIPLYRQEQAWKREGILLRTRTNRLQNEAKQAIMVA
jgi:transposase